MARTPEKKLSEEFPQESPDRLFGNLLANLNHPGKIAGILALDRAVQPIDTYALAGHMLPFYRARFNSQIRELAVAHLMKDLASVGCVHGNPEEGFQLTDKGKVLVQAAKIAQTFMQKTGISVNFLSKDLGHGKRAAYSQGKMLYLLSRVNRPVTKTWLFGLMGLVSSDGHILFNRSFQRLERLELIDNKSIGRGNNGFSQYKITGDISKEKIKKGGPVRVVVLRMLQSGPSDAVFTRIDLAARIRSEGMLPEIPDDLLLRRISRYLAQLQKNHTLTPTGAFTARGVHSQISLTQQGATIVNHFIQPLWELASLYVNEPDINTSRGFKLTSERFKAIQLHMRAGGELHNLLTDGSSLRRVLGPEDIRAWQEGIGQALATGPAVIESILIDMLYPMLLRHVQSQLHSLPSELKEIIYDKVRDLVLTQMGEGIKYLSFIYTSVENAVKDYQKSSRRRETPEAAFRDDNGNLPFPFTEVPFESDLTGPETEELVSEIRRILEKKWQPNQIDAFLVYYTLKLSPAQITTRYLITVDGKALSHHAMAMLFKRMRDHLSRELRL